MKHTFGWSSFLRLDIAQLNLWIYVIDGFVICHICHSKTLCLIKWEQIEDKRSILKYIFLNLQIPVTVYYETLCPDSQAFITEQLYPALNSPLAKLVDLKLVPFGRANVSRETWDILKLNWINLVPMLL